MRKELDESSVQELINEFKSKYSDNEFDLNENGEFCIIKNQKLKAIANFSLIPKGTVKNVDGKTDSYLFMGLIFDGQKTTVLPEIEVLNKDIASKSWLSNQIPLGMFNMSETKGYQLFKQFILRSQSKELMDVFDVKRSGWHYVGEKWVYVHSGGIIGETDKSIRLIETESTLKLNNGITSKEAFLGSLDMLNICDPKLTHALFSLVLVSVITSPLIQNDLAPKFSMWIEGRSGMGKTSLSKMFTQIFESLKLVHVYDFKKDLNKNIMNRDCVSIFDDYGTSKTKKVADLTNEKIEKLIRDIGDREVTSYFTVRPEGMVLFTGEKFITMGKVDIASSAGRVVRVQMDNLFDKKQTSTYDPLKVERFNSSKEGSFLSTSMASYLKWMSEKLNSHFFESYRRDFEYHRNYYSTESNIHSRQKDNFAHMTVSFNFYLAYGLEKGYITPEENAVYGEKAKNVFFELLKQQAVSPFDPDVQIFLDALEDLIVQGDITVIVKGIPYMNQGEGEVLGIVDVSDRTLSLAWQPVYDMVVKHILVQTDNSEFISDIKLGKLLREANLIYRSNDRVTKPVTGLNSRAIQFITNKFPALIEEIIEINKNRSFNELLDEYSKDYESNNRRDEEKEKYKGNKRKLDKLKSNIFENRKYLRD
ncbi:MULTISPECIES: hypothetical protein [Paenibacillus]|uniref:DUF927 domain-containing protein n=1 Tax=Paenibacillus odorifer TaxID=189426 RepID=A0AB36JCW1_9BACL|nr:hypothetical protein [Paenibacillus odorifer]OME16557.1 hypothetical protein BSK47_20060 [Paenibacillus odorifer]